MSAMNQPRRSKRISDNKFEKHPSTVINGSDHPPKMKVEVYIDDIAREAIASASYLYRCNGCGSPEELIVGTLNKGNRLSLWCATCYLVPHTESMVSEHRFSFCADTSNTVHLPAQVSKGVCDFVRHWPRVTSTRDQENTSLHPLLSKGPRNWVLQDMSRHRGSERPPGCEGYCSGCQSVQNNLKIWLPEVKGWYDRFEYKNEDGDWWLREGKSAARKECTGTGVDGLRGNDKG